MHISLLSSRFLFSSQSSSIASWEDRIDIFAPIAIIVAWARVIFVEYFLGSQFSLSLKAGFGHDPLRRVNKSSKLALLKQFSFMICQSKSFRSSCLSVLLRAISVCRFTSFLLLFLGRFLSYCGYSSGSSDRFKLFSLFLFSLVPHCFQIGSLSACVLWIWTIWNKRVAIVETCQFVELFRRHMPSRVIFYFFTRLAFHYSTPGSLMYVFARETCNFCQSHVLFNFTLLRHNLVQIKEGLGFL